jgi:hypothetical protein
LKTTQQIIVSSGQLTPLTPAELSGDRANEPKTALLRPILTKKSFLAPE